MLSLDRSAELLADAYADGATVEHGPLTLECTRYGSEKIWRVYHGSRLLDVLNPRAYGTAGEGHFHSEGT